jgi:cold shock CspA family protein
MFSEAKGFGFVQPDASQDDAGEAGDVFFHVKGFIRFTRNPVKGDRIEYVAGEGRDGRLAAKAIEFIS